MRRLGKKPRITETHQGTEAAPMYEVPSEYLPGRLSGPSGLRPDDGDLNSEVERFRPIGCDGDGNGTTLPTSPFTTHDGRVDRTFTGRGSVEGYWRRVVYKGPNPSLSLQTRTGTRGSTVRYRADPVDTPNLSNYEPRSDSTVPTRTSLIMPGVIPILPYTSSVVCVH